MQACTCMLIWHCVIILLTWLKVWPTSMQSVETLNELIASMFGPVEGRRHDALMLAESGLSDQLKHFSQPNGEPYVIYSNPAYGLSRHILAPFRGASLTREQQEFHKAMSNVRISVEWGFNNANILPSSIIGKTFFCNLLESIIWWHHYWLTVTLVCMALSPAPILM